MKSSAEIWWTGVIGASDYINCIEQSLEKKHSIALFIPQRIPWHDYFIELVKKDNPNRNTMGFNLINCNHVSEEDPGLMLLQRFGSDEQQQKYHSNVSISNYLFDNNILNNRTIWIYNVPERLEARWINFLCDFQKRKLASRNSNNGIICIELNNYKAIDCSYLDTIEWNKKIFEYDVLTFAMSRVRNIEEPESIKKYVSQVASGIASYDIELCDILIDRYYQLIRYPQETVQSVCDLMYSNNKALIFKMSKRKFNYIIWTCQEQVLFPIIERERLNFINKYIDVVSSNYNNPKLRESKEGRPIIIENPLDMELGTLKYICVNNFKGTEVIRNNDQDWKKLQLLHTARNLIAHLQPMDFKLFNNIINMQVIK